jgi:hypothetical protein
MTSVGRVRRTRRVLGGGAVALSVAATLLTACGARDGAAAQTGAAAATRTAPRSEAPTHRYRFLRDPIVVYTRAHPDPAHNVVFWIFVRLNRPFPRTGPGRRGNLLLEGARGDGLPFTDSRRPACYSQTIPADNSAQPVPALTQPHDGELVTVALRFPGVTVDSARVKVRRAGSRNVGDDRTNRKYLARLGC